MIEETQNNYSQIPLNESLFVLSSCERTNEENFKYFFIDHNSQSNGEKFYDLYDQPTHKQIHNDENLSKTDTKENDFYPNFNRNLKITQTLKLISKKVQVPRIYCEHFRRKKILMSSAGAKEFTLFDQVILFGNVKIETQYRDYETSNPPNPTDTSSFMNSIAQLIKYPTQRFLELTLHSTHTNQLNHFRFLTFYFRKIPDCNQQRLSCCLAEYSKILQNQVFSHIIQVRRLLFESTEFADQAFLTFSNIEEQIKQRMMNSIKNTQFFQFSLLKMNFQNKQMDVAKKRISYSLLELLGIYESDIDRLYNSSPQSLINFETNYKGELRLDQTILQLKALTKQQENDQSSWIVLQTIDGIDINVKCYFEYIYIDDVLDEVPNWMHYLDIIGVVVKYDVSPIQLQAVNQLRNGFNQSINIKEIGVEKNHRSSITLENKKYQQFESQMLKEIFVEQYYPEKLVNFNLIPSFAYKNHKYKQPTLIKNKKTKTKKINKI